MSSTPTRSQVKNACCPEVKVPRVKRVTAKRLSQSRLFRFDPLQAMLWAAALTVIIVPLTGNSMGLEVGSWMLLSFGAVVSLPLLRRLTQRTGVVTFAVYSLVVLAHSAVFSWPLELREAQLVVVLLGFAFMFFLKGGEYSIAIVMSGAFFAGSLMAAKFEFSFDVLGLPLAIAGILGATAAAIGGTLKRERSNRDKYKHLIESAPLPMWEVDIRGVAGLVREIQAQGGHRFCEHLQVNSELLREAGRRVEVLSANPLGMQLLPPVFEGGYAILDPANPIIRDLILAMLRSFWLKERIDDIDVSLGVGPDAMHFRFTAHGDGIGSGQAERVTVIASDVSQDKNRGADLEEQIAGRERFVASISHEIRTPLSTVVGLAQAILEDPNMSSTERTELLDIMVREGHDLSGIVEDLLVGARLDMGTLRIVLQQVHVRDEVLAVLAALGMKAEVAISATAVLKGNRIRFRQIIRNMLTNAGRYGGADLRILFGTNGLEGHVDVRDSGAPIPQEQRDLMFLPYQRLHDRPGVTESVGLGLPVSRSLAQAMDGDLGYDHDGDESIFRVSLPLGTPLKMGRLEIEVPQRA